MIFYFASDGYWHGRVCSWTPANFAEGPYQVEFSGPEYTRQRQVCGLDPEDPVMLVFVVPPRRFDSDWTATQHWTGDDGDASTSRTVKKSANTVSVPKTSKADKRSARASIIQFVLTLTRARMDQIYDMID